MTDDDAHQEARIALIMKLRSQGIRNARCLAAIERVPREAFVSKHFQDRAWNNEALPIECGQTISQPFIVAFLCQELGLEERERVLEIGTGSGYQAAVLSRLCRRVYTIERHPPLYQSAKARLEKLGYDNITTLLRDGTRGWPEQAPFDHIVITAATPAVPDALQEQLRVGGSLIAPVGPAGGEQELVRITRNEAGFEQDRLLAVRFVPLLEGVAKEP